MENESKSKTPETDAAWDKLCCSGQSWYQIAERLKLDARKMERERDESRLLCTGWACDCSGATCSPSSDAKETLAAWKKFEKTNGIVAFLKHAIHMERERNQWRNEHDRVVREYQHRLTVLATSAIEATNYPENVTAQLPPRSSQQNTQDASGG